MTANRAEAVSSKVLRAWPVPTGDRKHVERNHKPTKGEAYWAAKELPESASVADVVARVLADRVSS